MLGKWTVSFNAEFCYFMQSEGQPPNYASAVLRCRIKTSFRQCQEILLALPELRKCDILGRSKFTYDIISGLTSSIWPMTSLWRHRWKSWPDMKMSQVSWDPACIKGQTKQNSTLYSKCLRKSQKRRKAARVSSSRLERIKYLHLWLEWSTVDSLLLARTQNLRL